MPQRPAQQQQQQQRPQARPHLRPQQATQGQESPVLEFFHQDGIVFALSRAEAIHLMEELRLLFYRGV